MDYEPKVGDVFVSTYMYAARFSQFYQVVRRTAQSVTLRRLDTRVHSDQYEQEGTEEPILDSYYGDRDRTVRKSSKYGWGKMKGLIGSYSFTEPWDGKPCVFYGD